ncbi:MAG: sialidase family protein, partial [Acidimicrobiales bacterium]
MSRPVSRPVRLAAGVLLVGVGLVALAVGWQGAGARVHATAHAFINDDRPGINAHNSPSAVSDPARPDIIAVADRIDSPNISCSVSLSVNRGVTWDLVEQPLAPGTANCFWPDVAFAPDGDLLVLSTAMGGRFTQPLGVWLHRRRGLSSHGPPVRVVGPDAFHASLAVEGERVVVVYVQAKAEVASRPLGFPPPPNPLMSVTSTDGGRTFGEPVAVGEPERLVTEPSVVTGPDGLVVVSALDLGTDILDYEGGHDGQGGPAPDGRWRVVTWTSRDGGVSFGPTSSVTEDIVIPQRIYVDIGAPRPGLARDGASGRLYATWESGRGAPRDVFLASSTDNGAT